jgi:hypothetical protein
MCRAATDGDRRCVCPTDRRNAAPERRHLVELVAAFEEGQRFHPSGGYAGLVLSNVQFRDLR